MALLLRTHKLKEAVAADNLLTFKKPGKADNCDIILSMTANNIGLTNNIVNSLNTCALKQVFCWRPIWFTQSGR